ncbi:MAG: hypothetical protein WBQ23_08235 [Bacteroidota bacterium]
MTIIKYTLLTFTLLAFVGTAAAQEAALRKVALGEAREVVAEINGGFGTLYLKRGSGDELLTMKEKRKNKETDESDIEIDYYIEEGIGYLTVDMGANGESDMNALACLLNGNSSRTWYLSISDKVPIRFDITLGAGKASIDLTDIHVRDLQIDAGAGSVRLKMDKPNREEIGTVGIAAGVGSLRGTNLGNLRFQTLEFEGGLGEYVLDCSGDLPNNARITTDVGIGSLTIVLPKGIGAKATTDENWFSSRKMYHFIRKNDELYITPDYDKNPRRVMLNLQSGMGSVDVRWAK